MKNELWEFPFNSSQVHILSAFRIYIWNFDLYFPRTPTIMSIVCVWVCVCDSVLIWKLCYFSTPSSPSLSRVFFYNFTDCLCRYENQIEREVENQFNGNALGKSNEIIDQNADENIKKGKLSGKIVLLTPKCHLNQNDSNKQSPIITQFLLKMKNLKAFK